MDAHLDFNGNYKKCLDGSCPPLYFIMHNTSNVLESCISTSSHNSYKKGGADMFKALQHIKAKSYKLRAKLVDFSGTAQKEQLVYLARGDMSMSELMANPAHSTIVVI